MQGATWSVILYVLSCLMHQACLAEDFPPPCDSQIYCTGNLLHTVQMAKIFEDDKHFVDMGLRDSPARILKKFQSLSQRSKGDVEKLKTFLNTSFTDPGEEFEPWTPTDWHENPDLLSHIKDSELRKWASELHLLWKSLGRKIKEDVKVSPDRHSQIYVPNAVIVPGGRFREFYYWDSYWVINGLLLSEMNSTARGMIENFLYLVETFGFIPNGGRIYYLRRSQPPFLTLMMESYMEKEKDTAFLRENIGTLEKEYDFWMSNRSVMVTKDGGNFTMNRYYVPVGGPRPESYSDDYELAENLTADAQQSLWAELKGAAESGWDFSSRWFSKSQPNLKGTETKSVIPVDLNAILCRVENTLAKFYNELGMGDKALKFQSAVRQRREAVNSVLWDADAGVWLDYNIDGQTHNREFYPSNLSPIWASCYTDNNQVDRAVAYLEKSEALKYRNGLPTSLSNSGQQWDFPNAWPPLQHMVIEGLEQSSSTKAKEIAFSLAQKWVQTNYEAYKQYNAMFEKYDVEDGGKPGGGGEYEVQLGFGWSNGVILQLLDLYSPRLTSASALCSVSLTLLTLPFLILTVWT
ncbi:trehalase [Spea bombifrons]|uniref:trehalase n=1 Tax=Spea bombifrons TaxID=233779 RepID=UPI00234ADFFF|nr:trehalase [Spea bombifrons]